MRLEYRFDKNAIMESMNETLHSMEVAAHAAVTEAGQIAVQKGGEHVASRGFSSARWRRGFRSTVVPDQAAINVTATITHNIGYAGIFEEGGVIKGKPLLWLPIGASVPRGPLRGKRRGAGGRPLMFAKIDGRSVPVLHGVPSVTIPKRLDFAGVVQNVGDQLESLYFAHLTV
jgi:hypothetical protein